MAKSSLIGQIKIDLVANVGKMLGPMKQAQGALASFSKSVSKWTGIGAAITAPIAAFVSVHSAIAKISTAMDELGNLSDESKRLGIPADELSGLQYAAKQAGVETETLGKALQFMMKKGFSVSQLGKIADEMNAISDPVVRMQYALAHFGKGGAGMINMLEGGSKTLKEMVAEAKKLGYVVNQQNADLVEKSGDAWQRIKLAIDGMARTFAIQLAPYIILATDKMASFAASLNEGLTASGGMASFFSLMLDELEAFKIAWEAIVLINPISLWTDAWDADMEDTVNRWNKLVDDVTAKSLSTRVAKDIERIKAEVAAGGSSAGKITADPLGLMGAAAAASNDTSALIRGSQAAFSAIMASSKQEVGKASLKELEGIHKKLGDMSKRGVLFAPALLAGGT